MCSNIIQKFCTKCKRDKPLTNFSKKQTNFDGSIKYESQCRECKKIKDHLRYLKTKKIVSNEKQKKNGIENQIESNSPNFTYVFSVAKEGPDLKGAIDICTNQLKS